MVDPRAYPCLVSAAGLLPGCRLPLMPDYLWHARALVDEFTDQQSIPIERS
jgi:hypothetical protein